jgi:penicillin-binding protein 1A
MYRAPQIAPDQRRGYVPPTPPAYAPPREEIDEEDDDYPVYRSPPPPPPPSASRPRRRRSLFWRLVGWGIILGVWALICFAGMLVYFASDLPRPEAALDAARRPSLTLTDTSGRTIATYGDVVGEPMRLSDLPKYLPDAVVSVEDRRFWTHWGIDPRGIARAVFVNFTRGKLSQGGSTITQQVAKNLFLTNARTFKRKIQEVLLTLWLERTFTKQEILEIWLNRVYLGAGAWGVDAAAHTYFGISARDLNLWQSAVIAGLPRAPSRFSPRVDPQAAAARARQVLQAMAETGAISQQDAQVASASIVFPPPQANGAGYFADWAADRAQAAVPVGQDASVRTTLDGRLQSIAETRLAAILDGPGAAANVGQGAVVIIDPATGAIRAMVGGRDYKSSPYNRAVVARRQPGSSFKLFVWLNALEHGMKPDDTVSDAPIRVGNWSPHNFEAGFHGDVTLEDALADSINTVSVRLLLMAGGPKSVIAVAQRLGIADPIPDNATIALGTADVGLLEMATAYAEVFNGGMKVVPRALEGVEADGKPVAVQQPDLWRVVDPLESGEMVEMFKAVVDHGTARAANVPGHVVAGKTGTTSDFRDAWFIGAIDPGQPGSLEIAIWMGNDDGRLTKDIAGGTLPAKLFHDIAVEALNKPAP